jgi:hypothetical protein
MLAVVAATVLLVGCNEDQQLAKCLTDMEQVAVLKEQAMITRETPEGEKRYPLSSPYKDCNIQPGWDTNRCRWMYLSYNHLIGRCMYAAGFTFIVNSRDHCHYENYDNPKCYMPTVQARILAMFKSIETTPPL